MNLVRKFTGCTYVTTLLIDKINYVDTIHMYIRNANFTHDESTKSIEPF